MQQVKIIAEVGVNHNGDMSLAKEMIIAAAESGADYVKFQSWTEEKLAKGSWDDWNSNSGKFFGFESPRDFFKKTQLSDDNHHFLIEECKQAGVKFLTTCFDLERIDFLTSLDIDTIKIASCDATSEKMIRILSENFGRLIVSTGMCTIDEVLHLDDTLAHFAHCVPKHRRIPACNFPEYVLLHCLSLYPTPLEKISIDRFKMIRNIANSTRGSFGISDHSLGTTFPKFAISHGAKWVEKHFTTDRKINGPDNHMSIEPNELKSIRTFCDEFVTLGQDSQSLAPWKEEYDLRQALKNRFGNNTK